MWIGRQLNRKDEAQVTTADMGVTTIGGEQAAVLTRGELRSLDVWAPGGYLWRPKRGDAVLVIKGGTAGEEQCVLAKEPVAAPEGMESGEVYLYSDAASVYLQNNGTVTVKNGSASLKITPDGITLTGSVSVEGSLTVNGEACP